MAAETVSPTLTALNAKLFETIGALAFQLDRFRLTPKVGSDDWDLDEQELDNLRISIQRIGWLADLGANRNGGRGQLEEATDWMLSPALRDALTMHEIENFQRDNPPSAEAQRGSRQ